MGFVRSRVHCASRRQEKTAMGSKGESNGGMRKGRPGEPVIFIDDPPQRVDPTNAVTSLLNVPPNGLLSQLDRTLQIPQAAHCHNESFLKRRIQRVRKRIATTLPSTAR